MANTTLEFLCEMRRLLATPMQWTQGAFKQGNAYCLYGAARQVEGTLCEDGSIKDSEHSELYWVAMDEVNHTTQSLTDYCLSPLQFNDRPETTHADVLRVLDTTIARVAKKEEEAIA